MILTYTLKVFDIISFVTINQFIKDIFLNPVKQFFDMLDI